MDRREAGSNLDESLLSVEGCPLQATCSRRSEADVLITGDVNLCDKSQGRFEAVRYRGGQVLFASGECFECCSRADWDFGA